MISFDIGYVSDVGNKRDINQDSIFVSETDNAALFVIADGMGGMTDGEIASIMTTDSMRIWWKRNKEKITSMQEDMLINVLYDEINGINRRILDYCQKRNVKAGTTITVLLIRNDKGVFAYSGDSRLYRIRGDRVRQMTEDETLYNYYDKNDIRENVEKNKSILMSYIGRSENLALSIQTISVLKNDVYILCTDGFYNYLNIYDNENLNILKDGSAQGSANLFAGKIKRTKANDNFSAIVVKCIE